MFWILVGILLLTLFYFYGIKPLTYWRDVGVEQKNLFNAFIDNWFTLLKPITITEFMNSIYNEYPKSRYSGRYQFNKPSLLVRDVELIKQMVIKDYEHFNEHRDFVASDNDPVWSKNLFSLKGTQWRHMRTTLSPSFTSSKMKGMFFLMLDAAEKNINFFLKQNKEVIEIEMKDISSKYCSDVIASTAFGLEVDSQADPTNEFYVKGKEFTDLRSFSLMFRFFFCLIFPRLAKIFKVRFILPYIEEFFTNIIERTIKMREEQGIVRPDMIQLLLEAKKGQVKAEELEITDTGFATAEEHLKADITTKISNQDIVSQALLFFFAGFDTSSTLISFMAYELCANEDIQDKLREEIKKTLENCNKLTYEDLVGMQYMDMVVTETLRMWPSNVGIDRICTKPYTIKPTLPDEKPVHINVGVPVFLPIYGIQHDPDYFPNPEVFDPERFSDENKHTITPGAFQAFGLGPRNCIGSRFSLLETKIYFFHLLNNFKIVPIDKTVIPVQLMKNIFSILPKDGFHMGLKRI